MKNNKKAYQKLFKAALATSLATGAVVTVAPFNTEAAGFTDLKSTHVHYSSVLNLTERGIVKGFTDGTFKPEASVTRGQAAKIIALALGLDTKNVVNPNFKDIKTDNEYYGPIAALVAEGIVSGKEDGTYGPGEKLSRSQMAKIITLAFGFEEGKLTDTKFTDVKANDWYNGYLQTLLDNEITTGTTATTFSPYANVKRGQMASFVVRAEAASKPVTVISVSDNSVETSTGTYTIAEDLKKVFNATNAVALKNANIKFTEKGGQIVAVKSLEITAVGTEATNIVLDGANSSVAGSLKVNGDYVTVKNLTINGDLVIGKGVKNSFLADKIAVKGNTEVSDKTTGVSAAALPVAAKISFANSKLSTVVLKKLNASLNLTGTSSVTSINVDSNATVSADKNITIPRVTTGTGASEVTLNAATKDFLVNSLNFALNGTAKIGSITLVKADLKLSLGTSLAIENLVLPVGKTASDVISNFNAIKGQIEKIGGVANPDAGQVTPPAAGGGGNSGGGNGGGSGTDYTAGNALLDTILSANAGEGNIKDITVSLNENTNVFTVKIPSNSTYKLTDFKQNMVDVFTPLKTRAVVNSASVSFTAYGVDYVVSDSNINNNQSVEAIINNALDKVINTGITEDTALKLLIDNSLTISIAGTIDTKPFNASYVFSFENK
ncbi:S-layer homology domain-containing protein [Psychrobacillus sp. INOP01]|uniref:S-layer homology domain-containing protein n=1 Tax=Psychrobacillus sp. INOP01 TaxID=2829187 RepID=UPI001BA80F3D|nr:S-layer homology domain-containing protein [Psychrobacillus sp. INOP01]QUG40579.1 S-layer homology domain-containing protein [Psychrobacillus sp. INOP01]